MRTPFVGNFDFKFIIGRINFATKIAKFFGKQYIISGDDVFDEEFYIKSQDELLVRKIFGNADLKQILSGLKRVYISAKKIRGKNVDDEYEMSYMVVGVIKDTKTLKSVFSVITLLLDELNINGISKDEKARVVWYK